MRPLRLTVTAVALAGGLALAGLVPGSVTVALGAPQQPIFSARVDTVRVDVDVRRDDRPVAGLRAEDFEVYDNGVRQQVQLVAPTALSIDVVLALDTSSSLDDRERVHLTTAGRRVVDALQKGERAAVVTFSERVAIPTLFTEDADALRTLLSRRTVAGDTALHDAAHAAMLVGTAARGRSIVILFSDGDDTASFLTEDAVIDSAQRTGSVVCVVMIGGEGKLLRQLAETTGGVFVKETSLDKVANRFAEILQGFRERYLISFTPTGVDRPGWHKLQVKVKDAAVRARSGYWAGS
jgi:Ca-activated chloride channel homolog